ncbi:MAG TPA: hypothetical protein VFM05_02675 [Candidatus Saccharimonadales bacterium]|nr:hypothetical protein [Candidatus Saccharimonadales bacterium]
MKTLLIFGYIIVSLGHPWQSQRKPDRELDGLLGPVKTVRIEIANLDEEGKPDKDGRWLSRLTTYNRAGYKTEDETFYDSGKRSNGKFIYTYDDKGNLVEEAKYLNGSVTKRAFIYNAQGQLIKEVRRGGVFHADYTYDSEGRLTEIKGIYGENAVASRFVFTYDEKGQMIKRQRYGGGLDFEEIMIYDSQGRITSKANGSNPEDPDYQKVTYSYDTKGNLVEEVGYSNQGREGVNTYRYDFDSTGNWIRRTALREWDWLLGRRERKAEITYRTITYY